MFFSSSRSTERRCRAASSSLPNRCSAASASSSAVLRLRSLSSRPERMLPSCFSFSSSVWRYFTVSARSCLVSSSCAAASRALCSSAGRRCRAVSPAASAAACATCASVRFAVRSASSVRRLSLRAPLAVLASASRASSAFSALISAASFSPAASMVFATARWRCKAASASAVSCCPAAISCCREAALSPLRRMSFSSTAMRLSEPLICWVMLRISPFRRSTATVSCCACIRISSASCSAALVSRSKRS